MDSREHSILLTHASLTLENDREKMLEIMFEKFQVPSMSLGVQAVLALYAAGQMEGFVLDSGYGVTHMVPCDKGFDVPASVMRLDLAGNDLTNYLIKLLHESGYTVDDGSVAQKIKEKLCFVATDSNKVATSEYTLPNGQVIKLNTERTQCTEAIFDPTIIGVDSVGIHKLILESIQKCDASLQKRIYKKIILAGGNTMFLGMKERLEKELQQLVPQGTTVEIMAPPTREHSVWVGGSILGALDAFQSLLTTKQAYEESGSSIARKIE